MKLADVAVATITRARDRDEERLIAAALRRLSRSALPIAVADGGSSARFLESLRRLRGVTFVTPKHHGLISQVQASVESAHRTGRTFILYTESDKNRFFDRALVDFVRRAPHHAGIVLAARSEAGFKTFPPIQRLTESTANELCSTAIGATMDYFYGPFLMHRRLAAHVARAPLTLGWGWRPFLFATAHHLGYRIEAVVGDYRCPVTQRGEGDAEKKHRVRQLTENVLGIFTATLRGRSRSS